MELEAQSKEEFLDRLESLPSDVGSRLKRRSQEKKENFAIKHYFKLRAKQGLVEYPVRLKKNESPDYFVWEGAKHYGIEITEATFESYQYLLTANEKRPDMWFEPDVFIYGTEYPIETIQKYLKPRNSKLSGPGWGGVQAENYASGWARDSLVKKMETVAVWPSEIKENLRILLYQNCPAWLHDIKALGNSFKKRIEESSDEGRLKLGAVKVDYLSSDGEMMVMDVSGDNIKIDLSTSGWGEK
jgi:hypothetical protein